jgi:hypothetical protein
MKINFLIFSTFIFIFLTLNKANAVDIEFIDGSTIQGLTVGQIQHFNQQTIRYAIFYPDEFYIFQSYPADHVHLKFYGHPGSALLTREGLTQDLSSYNYLITRDISAYSYLPSYYGGWFRSIPSEPYPSEVDPETVPPIISLLGSTTFYIIESESFNDPGATAFDQIDGDVTSNITISGSVNTDVIGTYVLFYNVIDSDGNAANQVSRSIIVNSADVQNISTDQLEKLIVTIALTAFALAGFTTGMTYRFDS